jgi:hypothetical protein
MIEGAATTLNAKVRVVVPALAVKMVIRAGEATVAVTVKPAIDAAAGTFTVAGTLKLELLLERVTLNPSAGDGALRVTVQAAVPGALIVTGVQESPLKVGCVPVWLTEIVPPTPAERIPWPSVIDAATAVT